MPKPLPISVPSSNHQKRFWSKVLKTEGCWIWTGALAEGYGRFHYNKQTVRAHRMAYRLIKGTLDDPSLVIDHLCRFRACVNPEHLELVSTKVNVYRGISLPSMNRLKKYCPQGHVLVYRKSRPTHRYCLECTNISTRALRLQKKLARLFS